MNEWEVVVVLSEGVLLNMHKHTLSFSTVPVAMFQGVINWMVSFRYSSSVVSGTEMR